MGSEGGEFIGTGTYKCVCVSVSVYICVHPREEDSHIQHPLLSAACKHFEVGLEEVSVRKAGGDLGA